MLYLFRIIDPQYFTHSQPINEGIFFGSKRQTSGIAKAPEKD